MSTVSIVNKSQTIGNVVFVKSPLFNATLALAVVEKVISTRKV